jgi:hypothetical protein
VTVAVAPALTVTVNLGGCAQAHCLEMAWRLKRQLDPAYSRDASVLPLLDSFHAYQASQRTARKRAARAARLGYRFATIDRAAHADDIHAINTSVPERQGRPMGPGYHERPVYGPNPLLCRRHHVYTYGVLAEDTLVAYLWLYRSGELAMVSSILGHADHLADNVMYQLFLGVLREQYPLGGTAFYNLHSSGTDGLRFYKERVGLHPGTVRWALT